MFQENGTSNNSDGHRAGFDAFMTGFTLADQLLKRANVSNVANFLPEEINAKDLVNKLYLVCKDFPCLIQKSAFAKISRAHFEKYPKLMSDGNPSS